MSKKKMLTLPPREVAAMPVTARERAAIVKMQRAGDKLWSSPGPHLDQIARAHDWAETEKNVKALTARIAAQAGDAAAIVELKERRAKQARAGADDRRSVGDATRDLVRLEAGMVLDRQPKIRQTQLALAVAPQAGISYSHCLKLLKEMAIPKPKKKRGLDRRCGAPRGVLHM